MKPTSDLSQLPHDLRTTSAVAEVCGTPLKREDLRSGATSASLNRRRTSATAGVSGASLGLRAEPPLGRGPSRSVRIVRTIGMVGASLVSVAVAALAWPVLVAIVSNRMNANG